MRLRNLIFFGSFCVMLRYRTSSGQLASETDSYNEKSDNTVLMDVDGLVIEIKSPFDRANIFNMTAAIPGNWETCNDETYWESMYGGSEATDPYFGSSGELENDSFHLQHVRKPGAENIDRTTKDEITVESLQSNAKLSSNSDKDLSSGPAFTKSCTSSIVESEISSGNNEKTQHQLNDNMTTTQQQVSLPSIPEVSYDAHKRIFKRYITNEKANDELLDQNPDFRKMDPNHRIPRDAKSPHDFISTDLRHDRDLISLVQHIQEQFFSEKESRFRAPRSAQFDFFDKPIDDLQLLNEKSKSILLRTKYLQHNFLMVHDMRPHTFLKFLIHRTFGIKDPRICTKNVEISCDINAKFRSFDGSCNNIKHPSWGRRNTAFRRVLPPRYSDGIVEMPVSVTGSNLPNARKLSVLLYSRKSRPDPIATLVAILMGQTLAHDFGQKVVDETSEGSITCCADNGRKMIDKQLQHPSCAPISISPQDPFYSRYDQRCMNVVRSMTTPKEDCTLGPADQINTVTSFLDCSPVYGNSKSESDDLRAFTGGLMKMESRNGRFTLPTFRNQSQFCDIFTSDDVCFESGDLRTNQNPQLVVFHTQLVREHNRIARRLSKLNPHWDDERIFQETRRIVIAEYQHITYNEWLPLMLGSSLLRTSGRLSTEYNENVNPSTLNEFTTGAMRSLHSLIPGGINLVNPRVGTFAELKLSNHYHRPRVVELGDNFEDLTRGLVKQHTETEDENFSSEISEYLFRGTKPFGMDLAAIDIQRGRDHGLASYNAYRRFCGLRYARNFNDLRREISLENIDKLAKNYAHVNDIDLIVGITLENHKASSRLGPTARCLITEQFHLSRVSDRFFYDIANLPHSFTIEQFNQITKVTLARLLCDVGKAVRKIQREAFRAASQTNPLIDCENLPKMDLTLWQEMS